MPQRDTLIIDIASTAIPNAVDFIDRDSIKAPSNYSKPEAIAAYVEKEYQSRVLEAGLDLDLARISAIGVQRGDTEPEVIALHDETFETATLYWLGTLLEGIDNHGVPPTIVTYGGFHFDLPLLMRRARYLGVRFPVLNLDRYRSPHLDLLAILSDRDPSRRRPLGFYVKRLKMGLVKPLTGAEEALAPAAGRWDELTASVEHDLRATGILGRWMGLLEPVSEPVI